MEKALKLYNSKGAFPSTENQIEILGFKYDAKRMGGAPTISATVMYPTCLDNVWSDDVYVEFNGEKYYLNHTPTSSKSNEDERYKHEVTLVSERSLLDSIYFIDVAPSDGANQSPVTNSATFSFYGTIKEFAKRLNAAFEYSNLEYRVEIDKIVDTEEKLLSFDKQVLSAVLQESYNVFQVPYYFVGKKIYFDFFQSALPNTLKYGIDNELLSITKSNENFKIVNRCTGTGSAENIPYYYPNEHPLGKLKTLYNGAENSNLTIANEELFADNVKLHTNLVFTESVIDHITPDIFYYNYKDYDVWDKGHSTERYFYLGDKKWDKRGHWFAMPYVYEIREELTTNLNAGELIGYYKSFNPLTDKAWFNCENHAIAFKIPLYEALFKDGGSIAFQHHIKDVNGEMQSGFDVKYYILREAVYPSGKKQIYVEEINPMLGVTKDMFAPIYLSGEGVGRAVFSVFCEVWATEDLKNELPITINFETSFKPSLILHEWRNEDNRIISLSDYGLHLSEEPNVGDNVKFELLDGFLMPFQKTLMPPIYINTKGNERFYNALNKTHVDDNGDYYVFENEYSETKRREHIVEFPEIKPSIKNVVNANKEHINSFIEFAYDYNDTDEIDSNGQYIHPYFFGKLRKINHSEQGFNLFDRASASGEMTISMTSGTCGACNFVVGVNENTRKNTVQVYEEDVIDSSGKILHKKGSLKRNDRGEVIYLGEAQEMQNNTIDNEVWIALKKDASTYADVMPNAKFEYKPQACTKKADNSGYNEDGDTFVITNIIFPKSYLRAAEQELEKAIIQFMYENNVEKYSFSIKFSRIYFAEHPEILALLNENSFIRIEYNGETHSLYVNSITYKVDEKALPEITVELTKTLSASQSAIQTAITEVKTDVLDRIQKMDVAAMVANKFISKEHEDFAVQKITFNRGLNIGSQDEKTAQIDELGHAQLLSLIVKQFVKTPMFTDGFAGEGYQLWLDEKGYTNLTIDNITVRQGLKAFEFIIEKLRAVNGGLFLSAANGVIRTIEESEDGNYYLITFERDNSFVAGDYMRCSVYSGIYITDYWVEIDSVEEGVAKIKKSEFGLSMPRIGQEVVLCGSRHTERQNAIHISASDDGQPRISIYNGISTKSLFGCLRTQLGNLDNIKDELLKPQGDGLYSDNAYLKGEFILKNSGESVETKFAIQEGSIKSSVEQIQAEAIKGRTLLYNASFTKELEGWLTSDDKLNFTNGLLLLSSGSAVTNSVYVSGKPIFDDVYCLTINNGWIKQFNNSFVDKPQFDAEKQYPLFFSTNIRCNESGVLNVLLVNIEPEKATAFKGVCSRDYSGGDTFTVDLGNGTAWHLELAEEIHENAPFIIVPYREDFAELYNLGSGTRVKLYDWWTVEYGNTETAQDSCHFICSKRYEPTIGFSSLDIENLSWNGQGDFYLSFTGKADFYGLTIFTEKTEVRHQTLFEQTEKLIKISAQNFDSNGNVLESSSITTTAKMNAAISEKFNEVGDLINTAGFVTSTDLENMDLVDNEQLQGQLSNYVETESFAGLFAEAVKNDENVVKTATLAAYVKEDELGNLVSEIDIEADQINLTGYNINVDAANFKVKEDGSIVAKNAELNGYLLNMPVRIIQDNYAEFFDGGTTAWQTKKPVLANCVIIQHTSAIHNDNVNLVTRIDLPGVTFRDVTSSQQILDLVRSFIGQTITIYNETTDNKVYVYYVGNNPTEGSKQVQLKSHSFVSFKCNISAIKYSTSDTEYKEFVYWELLGQGSMKIPE